jgi:site-specific DNA-adenine methylase
MKPLFPYYGSKYRDAKRYPKPTGELVIEPFAGSAGYSTYWIPPKVHLYDVDPIIVGVWQYLIHATPGEIRRLPDLEVGQSIDDIPRLPQEARWLIGFWLNRGSAQPKKTKTAFSARTERSQLVWSERARERIAFDVQCIRDWRVTLRSYAAIDPRQHAMWFVDPPYVDKGRYYRYRDVDYAHLGAWCRQLAGRVIACEQTGATWLPFEPLAVIKSTRGTSAEAVWLSHGLAQSDLFSERAA